MNLSEYSYLLHPLVGAIIGYITNWIAVKMLFRPRKAYYIGKLKLPFTPGIIPRNQSRLARGISNTISNSLLNEETLKENLLSDSIKDQIKAAVDNYLNETDLEPFSLNDLILRNASPEVYNDTVNNLIDSVSNSIFNTVKEANLASSISHQIEEAINENMKQGFLSNLARKPIVSKIAVSLEPEIDNYINEHGKEIIHEMVSKEITKYLNTSTLDLKEFINKSNIDASSFVVNIYTQTITSQLTNILNTINIKQVIENKINSMDAKTVEDLVLSIISRELNALVSLGAFIGFILGLANIFIK